jgi:hypothetical protein
MQWSTISLTWFLGLAIFASSSSAYGQSGQTKADELFNKAVELSESRNYDQACPLLAESQKLDPRPGTLFALGDCEREWGKIGRSVKHFKAYLKDYEVMKADVRKRHNERANLARGYIKTLQPNVPTLKLSFPEGIPAEFVLTVDGERVERVALDTELLFDPGDHVVVVQVPGHTDSEQRITLALKEKKALDVAAGPEVHADTSQASSSRRKIGFVLLGTGAAGLVFGSVMGGMAVGQKNVVDEHCNVLNCDRQGFEAVGQGRTFGTLSTIGFAAGGVLAAAGVVLVLTAPKEKSKSSWLTGIRAAATAGSAFFGVEGQF